MSGRQRRPSKFNKKLVARIDWQEVREALAGGHYQFVVDRLSKSPTSDKPSTQFLHLLGLAWLGLRDIDQGVRYLEAALQQSPDATPVRQDLSRVYYQLGRYEDAANLLRQLLSEDTSHVEYWRNYALVLERAQQLDEALAVTLQAIERFPTDAPLCRHLADLYEARQEWPAAAAAYRSWGQQSPSQRVDAIKKQVAMLRRTSDHDATRAAIDEWLSVAPQDPVANHLRGAYQQDAATAQASSDYVRQLFDQVAGKFESHLAALDYQGPQLIADQLARCSLPKSGTLNVADLGCGTGLLGPYLRPYAARLTGVDLSRQMLDLAAQRSLYDAIVESELTEFLNSSDESFDLIASADTLNYIGDLRPFAQAARRALHKRGGWLVFTIETHLPPSDDNERKSSASRDVPEFVLQVTGRYTHDVAQLLEILQSCDFVEITSQAAAIRREAEKDAPGAVISCRLSASG